MARRRVRAALVAISVSLGLVATGATATGAMTLTAHVEEPGIAVAPAERLDPPVRRLTISATGDILVHSPLWAQASRDSGGVGFDFGPMFADVARHLGAADLAICHLETPIAPAGQALSTFPLYGVPVEIAAAIAGAGYDRCSTASNHTFDRGVAGIDRTVSALEAVGVQQSGMARFPSETIPQVVDVGGVGVAHLSYTYGFNGVHIAPADRWRSSLIDVDRIIEAGRDARRRGADFVVLSLHWGIEADWRPSVEQRRVADAVTASGAVDLVIGHHAHVLQPIERINGVWVAFGLGNALSNMPTHSGWPAASQDAAIVDFTANFLPDPAAPNGMRVVVERPRVAPTWVDKQHGWVIRNVLTRLADPAVTGQRRHELEASLARTMAVLGEYVVG